MIKNKTFFSLKSIIFIVVMLILSLTYVKIKVDQIMVGYKISENNKIEKSYIHEKQSLLAKLTELNSPQRLERLAKNLGFKFPTQDDIVFIQRSTVVDSRK